MKKQLILCGLAAAVAGMAYATVDKLNFIKNDEVIKTILINSIDHLSYHGDTDGFTHIDVTSHDGSVTSYSLDGIDHVAYVNGLPENPVSVTVEPHHACATLHVTTSDPNTWYRFNGVPESELAGIPEDQWLDYLIEDDLNYIYDITVAYGYELDRSFLPNIFERGDKVRDWFPPGGYQRQHPHCTCRVHRRYCQRRDRAHFRARAHQVYDQGTLRPRC